MPNTQTADKQSIFERPSDLFSLAQLLFLILVAGYIFAVLETNQKTNTTKIGTNESVIKEHSEKIQAQEIRQAVTTQQYNQIIQTLNEIKENLKNDSNR